MPPPETVDNRASTTRGMQGTASWGGGLVANLRGDLGPQENPGTNKPWPGGWGEFGMSHRDTPQGY
jgi:hypothetical protein